MSATHEMAQKESDANATAQKEAAETMMKAQAATMQAVNESKQVDPMLFLREASMEIYNDDSYFFDERIPDSPKLYMLMRGRKQQIRFLQYLEKIMVSGQVLVRAIQPKTAFTIENFHQVFNGVQPLLQESDPERAKAMRKELLAICKAILDYPLLSLRWRIYREWGATIKEKLVELRIPQTKDGAEFSSMDFLLGGVGGEYLPENIHGAVFHYMHIDGKNPGPYVAMITDHAPSDENNIENMQFNVRVFLSAIMQLMHRVTGEVLNEELPKIADSIIQLASMRSALGKQTE